jgi:hypothetical protein
MDEETKNEYIDEIKKEVEREPSFNENKILQALEEQLRELYKSDPALADDISELLLQIQSGEFTDTAADADAAAGHADAVAAELYQESIAWEKENLGHRHGGGKRRKTKRRKTKKRRSKKRRSKKRRSKKRRTSTRRTRRR